MTEATGATESQRIIEQAGRVRNVMNRGRLVEKATRYLRFNERERRKAEKQRIETMLSPQNIQLTKMGETAVKNARRHLRDLTIDLEDNTPPSVNGQTKDAIYTESKRLEEKIREGMLSHEEMRRNPVGAVDHNIKWERQNKGDILKWKNLQLLLHPDSDEQDLCNVEKLRPSNYRADGAPTWYMESQIPGKFAMTPQAKENWPEGMPEHGTVDSPMKQVERREMAEEMVAQGTIDPSEIEAMKETIKQLQAQLGHQKEVKEKRRQRGLALAAHAKAKREERAAERSAERQANQTPTGV